METSYHIHIRLDGSSRSEEATSTGMIMYLNSEMYDDIDKCKPQSINKCINVCCVVLQSLLVSLIDMFVE